MSERKKMNFIKSSLMGSSTLPLGIAGLHNHTSDHGHVHGPLCNHGHSHDHAPDDAHGHVHDENCKHGHE